MPGEWMAAPADQRHHANGLGGVVAGLACVTLRRIRLRVSALHPGEHPFLRPDRMPRLQLRASHGQLRLGQLAPRQVRAVDQRRGASVVAIELGEPRRHPGCAASLEAVPSVKNLAFVHHHRLVQPVGQRAEMSRRSDASQRDRRSGQVTRALGGVHQLERNLCNAVGDADGGRVGQAHSQQRQVVASHAAVGRVGYGLGAKEVAGAGDFVVGHDADHATSGALNAA